MSLLRAELLKLVTVRTTWVMLGIGFAIEALFAGLYTGLTPMEDIGEIEGVLAGTGIVMLLTLILGVLVITNEFRHGTANATFLVTPRRTPVLVAKLAAAVIAGLVIGAIYVAINGGLALGLYSSRGGELPDAAEIASLYAGVIASFSLLAAFGLGIGAIVRNQVGAISAVIAVIFVISTLFELVPGDVGRYFPAQAIGSLHGSGEGPEEELSQVLGGLVLAGWALAMWAIGTALTRARDLTE